jgi:hypothetical protein
VLSLLIRQSEILGARPLPAPPRRLLYVAQIPMIQTLGDHSRRGETRQIERWPFQTTINYICSRLKMRASDRYHLYDMKKDDFLVS